MNRVILIGRLTKDVVVRKTNNGRSVASFTLAVDDYGGRDENGNAINKAYFFNCVLWGDQADSMQNYTSKGSQIAVEGKLTTRTYVNSTGANVLVTEINCSRVEFVGSKKQSSSGNTNDNEGSDSGDSYSTGDATLDDLPF